ncbi:MAG TPA: class I SAM-dependent methyltransferase [Roseiflexaceae bacterium]|nr:class I SAM-dependent methyltransferase [Roseiflexaceae bacterium]
MVRWTFERLYRELAWGYDLVAAAVSGGRWRAWALTAVPLARGRTLELGCGTGHLQRALAGRPGVEALGLDRSPQMIAIARRTAAGAGHAPRLLRADARALPLLPATVDTVVATFPSEYIADPAVAAEIRRVLRPGGQVAVALWAQITGDSLYLRALDLAYRLTLQRSPRSPSRSAADAGAGSAPLPAAQRHLADALAACGLRVTHTTVQAPGSRVHYVVGVLEG